MKNGSNNAKNEIAIIGAGAAGLFAAAAAIQNGAHVTIFERNEVVGRKLSITGNGRCNFTNSDLNQIHFRNPQFVHSFLQQFDAMHYADYFASLGILSFAEKNGCFYPASQKAQTMTQGLYHYLERMNATFVLGTCISEIKKNELNRFVLSSKEKSIPDQYDAVILACGGKAAPKTGSDGYGFRLARGFGHTVSRTYPVLVQLKSSSSICRKCKGIRIRVKAFAYIEEDCVRSETGELQITEYGLSGIVTFNLSRELSKALEEGLQCSIHVDLLPELSIEQIPGFLENRFHILKQDTLIHFMKGLSNPQLMEAVLNERTPDLNREVTVNDIPFLVSLFEELKDLIFPLTGHNGYENAQATQGGVLLNEIYDSMESKLISGLYFAGEMLDVDADCGGYNLHWAWMSGEIAGACAAKKGVCRDSD